MVSAGAVFCTNMHKSLVKTLKLNFGLGIKKKKSSESPKTQNNLLTTLSTLSINHFKMSAEPPNQNQLGPVAGL